MQKNTSDWKRTIDIRWPFALMVPFVLFMMIAEIIQKGDLGGILFCGFWVFLGSWMAYSLIKSYRQRKRK